MDTSKKLAHENEEKKFTLTEAAQELGRRGFERNKEVNGLAAMRATALRNLQKAWSAHQ